MDHSYRAAMSGNGARPGRQRPGFAPSYAPVDPDPIPQGKEDANSRIFAFVDDLFFMAKIQETARKLNVKVEFIKTEKDLLDRIKQNGDEKPSLIIFDMNNANAKPLTLIPKLKTKLKKTSIIGFLSHVQGDLKQKAHEVGCRSCCVGTARRKKRSPSKGAGVYASRGTLQVPWPYGSFNIHKRLACAQQFLRGWIARKQKSSKGLIRHGSPNTSPSSWTATDAGREDGICRASPATVPV